MSFPYRNTLLLLLLAMTACSGSIGDAEDAEKDETPDECTPSCDLRTCGDDGCAGVCGVCEPDEICTAGSCVECIPSCDSRACGDDGCGGTCGTCAPGTSCTAGTCEACTPSCNGLACGNDGCGGTCGTCPSGTSCTAGTCEACTPSCDGLACGNDGCGGTCGTCAPGETCSEGSCAGSTPSQTVEFTEDKVTDFLNPERGWYIENSFDGTYRLAMRYVRLDDYRNGSIPSSFLDALGDEMTGWRTSGTKAILRFAYNRDGGGNDASLSRVLEHIGQLSPLLHEHADVIAVVQAGFIGAWGEWHTSSNKLSIDPSARIQIMDALLASAPTERMVQVRKPDFLADRFPTVLSSEERFTGTPQSRLAHHNDCFLAGASNGGTYGEWDGHSFEEDRAYVSALGQLTAMGGETCDLSWPSPESECPNALADLAAVGWDYLNLSFFRTMIDRWRSDGCFDEISRRLGYRYVLEKAVLPSSMAGGEVQTVSLTVRNVGFGKLYNERPLQLVLDGPGGPHVVTLYEDARRELPLGGQRAMLSATFEVPAGLQAGQSYAVHVRMPDASPHLADDVRHMIRFANEGTWDPDRGWNRLGATVQAR